MADRKHGEMDITEQERTFASFISWSMRVAIGVIVFLLLLVLING